MGTTTARDHLVAPASRPVPSLDTGARTAEVGTMQRARGSDVRSTELWSWRSRWDEGVRACIDHTRATMRSFGLDEAHTARCALVGGHRPRPRLVVVITRDTRTAERAGRLVGVNPADAARGTRLSVDIWRRRRALWERATHGR